MSKCYSISAALEYRETETGTGTESERLKANVYVENGKVRDGKLGLCG